MELVIWTMIFALSFVVLLKASDSFTHAAEKIGLFFRLPEFVIGVTIVAFGTSSPELVSGIIAVLSNASEIVIANVIGANISNIFLILGITTIVAGIIKTDRRHVSVDLPILMGSALLLGLVAVDGKISRFEAVLLLAGLGIYILHSRIFREAKSAERRLRRRHLTKNFLKNGVKNFPHSSVMVFLLSLGLIIASAKFAVEAAIRLSGMLGVGTELIAGTLMAMGTTLPELAVSIAGVRHGKSDMVLGNILGSFIFNILGVLGIAGLFGNIAVPQSLLFFGLPLMIVAVVMYLFITHDKKITRWEGSFLLVFYFFYLGRLFGWF